MGSPLLSNENVTFVVTKPFTSGENEYAVGDDFPQEDARNIEVLVRARFVAPVVEDLSLRPKYWYKEVKLKSDLLEKLNRDRVQLRMHHEPDSDEVVNLERLTRPESTPEAEELHEETEERREEDTPPPSEAVHEDQYDPSYHTVVQVNEYLATASPEERERVLEAERNGKARKGILES